MEPSPAIEQCVHDHARKLEHLCPTLTSCQVTIDSPHRHKLHGRPFRVRIEVGVPGAMLVVAQAHGSEDAYAALSTAFEHAARKLSDLHRDRRRHQN
jgi:ribosome-associated translation inhibitor RaiA